MVPEKTPSFDSFLKEKINNGSKAISGQKQFNKHYSEVESLIENGINSSLIIEWLSAVHHLKMTPSIFNNRLYRARIKYRNKISQKNDIDKTNSVTHGTAEVKGIHNTETNEAPTLDQIFAGDKNATAPFRTSRKLILRQGNK